MATRKEQLIWYFLKHHHFQKWDGISRAQPPTHCATCHLLRNGVIVVVVMTSYNHHSGQAVHTYVHSPAKDGYSNQSYIYSLPHYNFSYGKETVTRQRNPWHWNLHHCLFSLMSEILELGSAKKRVNALQYLDGIAKGNWHNEQINQPSSNLLPEVLIKRPIMANIRRIHIVGFRGDEKETRNSNQR